MKIRGKPIEDVIKIEVIDHDGKFDENKNTNELEIKHIISKLKEFKEKNIEQSLGIITPHREQVTLLFDKINELPERDWLFNKCKLKIMTFDTCQGEERDYIFYSMVAVKEKDRLNWIFLKDFSLISDEIDGTIKSQRLNVGFSRAKECIHFVLSKPIEDFQGEIKNAMLHYQNELKIGKERIVKEFVSEMEYKIDEIFHNTKFYKDNKEKISFIPQFELGKYLKQLNKDYNHPNYKVDFLLIFNGSKIVIEYDGFKEHFVDRTEVNESNYKYYMKADDVYRQKVLEGYGYKFLRINRFNIGKNPVEKLDERLQDLIKKKEMTR
jgi:very-short-patch-repair endonuclease